MSNCSSKWVVVDVRPGTKIDLQPSRKKIWISQSYQISKISRDSRDARESRVQRVRGFQGCQDSRDSRDAKDSMAKMGNSHRIDPDPSKMHVRPTKIIRIKFRIDFKRWNNSNGAEKN